MWRAGSCRSSCCLPAAEPALISLSGLEEGLEEPDLDDADIAARMMGAAAALFGGLSESSQGQPPSEADT